MGRYNNDDFSGQSNLWGHTDILDADLEKLEFDKNFDSTEENYNSILDDEPAYHSLMNFPEEEQDELYAYEVENEEDYDTVPEDDTFDHRDSYRDTDRDDAFYLI
ncbi:MAG TPA: hypothetical protein VK623_00140 [Flavobacterium sp.]|nr:hypothetical protein [Flavobacterium sp.]